MVIKGAAEYETKTNGDFMLEFTYVFLVLFNVVKNKNLAIVQKTPTPI